MGDLNIAFNEFKGIDIIVIILAFRTSMRYGEIQYFNSRR